MSNHEKLNSALITSSKIFYLFIVGIYSTFVVYSHMQIDMIIEKMFNYDMLIMLTISIALTIGCFLTSLAIALYTYMNITCNTFDFEGSTY